MKKLLLLLAGAAVLGAAVVSIPGFAQNGNGITSNGPHYNLNLIGVTKGKNAPLTGSDRHTIFVPLYSKPGTPLDTDPAPGADIWLTQGPFNGTGSRHYRGTATFCPYRTRSRCGHD